MQKKLLSILLILSMLLTSMLTLSSCNDTDALPTDSDSSTETDAPESSDHTHAFGAWETLTAATCTEQGLQERVCSCGEKESTPIPALKHAEVPYETLAATAYTTGFEGGTYCSACKKLLTSRQLIPTLNTLALPTANATTVTEEQWIRAFDLIRLQSFTLSYQERAIEASYSDEDNLTEENFLGYFTEYETNATVKYNSGNIFISATRNNVYNNTIISDEATGTIEFQEENKFREVDSFSNSMNVGIQPAEALDDSIYDLEKYGYSLAVYSEETHSYTIEVELQPGVIMLIEACFENNNLTGCRVCYLMNDSGQEAIFIFSNINENLPIQ